jgi:hypothetical protein
MPVKSYLRLVVASYECLAEIDMFHQLGRWMRGTFPLWGRQSIRSNAWFAGAAPRVGRDCEAAASVWPIRQKRCGTMPDWEGC